MNRERLERLLGEVKSGKASIASALKQLRSLPFEDLGFASLDHHRSIRQGFPEVILCEGKTPAQIRGIAGSLLKHHRPFLATRATRDIAAVIQRIDRRAVYHRPDRRRARCAATASWPCPGYYGWNIRCPRRRGSPYHGGSHGQPR
jgi:NCAIR mutase (PurE)-related protein